MGTSSILCVRLLSVLILQRLEINTFSFHRGRFRCVLYRDPDFPHAGGIVPCQGRADVESIQVDQKSDDECGGADGDDANEPAEEKR